MLQEFWITFCYLKYLVSFKGNNQCFFIQGAMWEIQIESIGNVVFKYIVLYFIAFARAFVVDGRSWFVFAFPSQ